MNIKLFFMSHMKNLESKDMALPQDCVAVIFQHCPLELLEIYESLLDSSQIFRRFSALIAHKSASLSMKDYCEYRFRHGDIGKNCLRFAPAYICLLRAIFHKRNDLVAHYFSDDLEWYERKIVHSAAWALGTVEIHATLKLTVAPNTFTQNITDIVNAVETDHGVLSILFGYFPVLITEQFLGHLREQRKRVAQVVSDSPGRRKLFLAYAILFNEPITEQIDGNYYAILLLSIASPHLHHATELTDSSYQSFASTVLYMPLPQKWAQLTRAYDESRYLQPDPELLLLVD